MDFTSDDAKLSLFYITTKKKVKKSCPSDKNINSFAMNLQCCGISFQKIMQARKGELRQTCDMETSRLGGLIYNHEATESHDLAMFFQTKE